MDGVESHGERQRPPATRADADLLIRVYRSEQQRRIHNGAPFDCSLADLSPGGRRYYADLDLADEFHHPAAVPA